MSFLKGTMRPVPLLPLLNGCCCLILLSACRTVSKQPPMDLSEPGWTLRQGQAVWRAKKDAAEIAGELLVAMHPDGRSLVQFTKTPLPFVVAQWSSNFWQVQFVAENKTYAGRGLPPNGILWLHLPHGLVGGLSDANWSVAWTDEGRWRFENVSTGETLEGFLTTTSLPKTHLVARGETVASIARWYGIPARSIRMANPGIDPGWLVPGTSINLPPPQAHP